jgi:hypothetical protein
LVPALLELPTSMSVSENPAAMQAVNHRGLLQKENASK